MVMMNSIQVNLDIFIITHDDEHNDPKDDDNDDDENDDNDDDELLPGESGQRRYRHQACSCKDVRPTHLFCLLVEIVLKK